MAVFTFVVVVAPNSRQHFKSLLPFLICILYFVSFRSCFDAEAATTTTIHARIVYYSSYNENGIASG